MFARFQRALIVLLICILPVQAMAAALVPLSCGPTAAHSEHTATQAGHAHAAAAAVQEHDHGLAHYGLAGHNDESAHANLCCHQFVSATPSAYGLATPQDFTVYVLAVTLLTPLHIPELPQRPPRA